MSVCALLAHLNHCCCCETATPSHRAASSDSACAVLVLDRNCTHVHLRCRILNPPPPRLPYICAAINPQPTTTTTHVHLHCHQPSTHHHHVLRYLSGLAELWCMSQRIAAASSGVSEFAHVVSSCSAVDTQLSQLSQHFQGKLRVDSKLTLEQQVQRFRAHTGV
jgi:hypothetical protein